MATKKAKSSAKSSVQRRAVNPAKAKMGGSPGHEQDPQRRLGNFTGKGEHARVGGRTSGIVGQKTKQQRTDKKSK